MRKILFCLLGACVLSVCLLRAHPENQRAMEICHIEDKNTMVFCAIKYLQENYERPLSIHNLTLNKPQLVRNVSYEKSNQLTQSLHDDDVEQVLVDILIEQWCPASPVEKRRKVLSKSNSYFSSQDSLSSELRDENDCVVTNTPPTTPVTPDPQTRAIKQIDRLHRQWKTKWKSDNDLQSMLAESLHAGRKRSNSDYKQ